MKKQVQFLLPLLLCGMLFAQAQSECDLYITTNFDSECLLTEYFKDRIDVWEQGFENCLTACKGNTMRYTAVCSSTVTQYSWTISGAASYHFINQNQTAVVTWGYGDVGNVSVNVVTSDTNTCTAEACVLLMESPQIASETVPAYYMDQGNKVIEICLNGTVELMDMSTAGQTPIVGCFWETPFGDASTPNHTITASQTGEYIIVHRVQNECGCEDYEEITLRIVNSTALNLSCYGTVCAGSQETYTLLDPYCWQYMWSVEGGTYIVDPSDPATIHVQWGNPSSGYGVISIDASFCQSSCKALTSIKIPVISQNASISGPDVVCVGDVQQFELPVWGSTSYFWQVIPSSWVTLANTEELNRILLQFGQTGDYTLQAIYECDFLGCGPDTTTKTIEVKDTMSIKSGDNTLCKGATGHYTTWQGNSVTWHVFNQNDEQIYYSNGVALIYTFTDAGRYKIVASGSSYCDDAEYWVTVLNNPPALTVTNGPHVACLNSSILLNATPTHPTYYLEWVKLCAPHNSENGDEVTINYGSEVCDVAVYQIDAENGCRSDAFIHEVDTFRLAASGLPSSVPVCAGDTLNRTVPLQDNVLYEWTISPAGVASIQGDHFSNSVTILVNHLANNQPTYAVVTLKRTCCSGDEYVETFTLTTMDAPTPTISYSTSVCQGDNANFYVTSSVTNPSDYTWHIGGSNYVGNTASHIFNQAGNQTFTLDYHPYPSCPAVVVSGTVELMPAPVVAPYFDGQNVGVIPYPNASYVWEVNGNAQQINSNICPYTTTGTYCCTVTYTTTPFCSSSGCITIEGNNPIGDCVAMPCSSSVACTTAAVSLTNTCGGQISWSIAPQIFSNAFTYTDNTSASLNFSYPGVYTVMATATVNGQCYRGTTTCTIECVPEFSLSYTCNNPVAFEDKSLCLTSGVITSRSIYIQETGTTYNNVGSSTTFPLSSFEQGGTNHVTMTVYLSNGQQCQVTKTLTIDSLPTASWSISQYMCEGTPFLFSANATGSSFLWNFGDGTFSGGNNIYHTFDNSSSTVTLFVENNDGCSTSLQGSVVVFGNALASGNLFAIGQDVCPGTIRQISFSPHHTSNSYYWEYSPSSVATNIYNTYQTGDYHLLVTNSYGCKKERMKNVTFLNAPTARITGNTTYCLGEEVKLNGNTGSSNSYTWSITGPSYSQTFTTSNITFTPTQSGVYNVALDVTNISSGCSKTATCTVTVHPQPAAPPISFYNNECIHTPPVYVHSTASPVQILLWSNGFHGSSAEYYVPGFLSAHYIDPTTGCPSAKSKLFIPPAPNYDAMLTGCYKHCKQEIPDTLHVYNFYPHNFGSFHWDWYENNNWIVGGNTLHASLPLNNHGFYFLETQYGNGCVSTSPTFTLDTVNLCPCDSIDIELTTQCEIADDCSLYYTMDILIHNNSSQPVTFNQLYNHASLFSQPLAVTITPHGSQLVPVLFNLPQDLSTPYVTFTLLNAGLGCETSFTVYFDWYECVEEGCELVDDFEASFEPDFSIPHQTSYFNVHLSLSSNASNLQSLWCDPPQVLNYYYNPFADIYALLMFSYAQLTQMAEAGEEICLHAIICDDGTPCHVVYCIPAEDILLEISEDMRQLADSITADNDTSVRRLQADTAIPIAAKPYLAPNPARDEVTVMGIAPEEVAEIGVLTMQGGQVAEYRGTYRFNVSRLAKASYIVRVITTDKQVHYLKLVKQ